MKKIIYLEICVIVVTYLIGSLSVPKNFIPLFSICWQLAVILYLFLIKKIHPNFNLMLTVVLLAGFSAISWFGLGNHNVSSIIRSIILAPLMEEMLFREYIFNNLTGKSGRKIFLSSVIFGAYHIKNILLFSPLYILRQIFSAIVLGLINGYLKARTRSLTMPIAIHSFNNGVFASLQKIAFKFLFS